LNNNKEKMHKTHKDKPQTNKVAIVKAQKHTLKPKPKTVNQ